MRVWRASPKVKDATANLMKETRLTAEAKQKAQINKAVLHDEQKLSRTQEALGILGAGHRYGD